jgi:hypothetical protein
MDTVPAFVHRPQSTSSTISVSEPIGNYLWVLYSAAMRSFLRGRPAPIVVVGGLLMFYGVSFSYLLGAFAWGGFLNEPIVVQAIGFSVPAAIFLGGAALFAFGGFRRCRSATSS